MAGYIDLQFLKDMGNHDPDALDDFEEKYAGRIDKIIEALSRQVDGRLAKRYQTPFGDDPPVNAPAGTARPNTPIAIQMAVAGLVSYHIWLATGFNPSSEQDELIVQAKDDAWAYIKEAADSKDGMVELPKREAGGPDKNGVSRAAPIGSSDASPYAWTDRQRERNRNGGR